MNGDEIANMVKQVLTLLLSSAGASAYVSGNDAVAIATGAGALASVGWSVYAHWNMKKVPENAPSHS